MTLTRGAHTIQLGANYRLILDHRRSDAFSYSYGYTNAYALAQAGIANTGQSFDPASFGYPAVAGSFADSYNFAMGNLAGLLDLVTTQSNYQIAPGGSAASLMPAGAILDREFKNNEFEYYLQDSWRIQRRLTLTFGVRHTLLETPFEIHGQQAQPTVNIDQWFRTRAQQAALGNSVQPDLSFAPSGQARGLKAYWPMQKKNIAPRVAVAFSPGVAHGFWHKLFGAAEESSIRAGYGIYYDHYGEGIVNLFDQYGAFGLSESITNPTNLLTPGTSPRFTGIHDLPDITGAPANTIAYPALAPNNPLWTGFEIAHGLDDRMKTPYSQGLDFSIQRELPGAFALEIAYSGRFGRHQLQQIDLAQPLDLVDPKSGQTTSRQLPSSPSKNMQESPAWPLSPTSRTCFPMQPGAARAQPRIFTTHGFPATKRVRSTRSIFSALPAAEARRIASGPANMPACMRGRPSEAAATTPDRLRCDGR